MQPWYFDRNNQSLEEGTVANTVTKETIKEKSLFFSISAVRSKDGWSSERWLEKMMEIWREGNWKEDESRPPQKNNSAEQDDGKSPHFVAFGVRARRSYEGDGRGRLSDACRGHWDMGELARWGCISAQRRSVCVAGLAARLCHPVSGSGQVGPDSSP